MKKVQNLFFSCVDSRIQDQGTMYARFHLGTFFHGQALTFANALRRILLSEIPSLLITDVVIEGASHEFAILPGVEETVLDFLLNLKTVVFTPWNSNFTDLEKVQTSGFLKFRGPGKVTAADLKLPLMIKCVNPKTHLATLTSGEEISLRFNLAVCSPHTQKNISKKILHGSKNQKIVFETVPMPVQKVNYVIKSLNTKQGSEYVVLEIWTDGSLLPQEAVQFALKKTTQLFYQFAFLSK
jgi:DNA-directed RNA polymerase subunit alpha